MKTPKSMMRWAQVYPSGRYVMHNGQVVLWKKRKDANAEVFGSERPVKVKIVRL